VVAAGGGGERVQARALWRVRGHAEYVGGRWTGGGRGGLGCEEGWSSRWAPPPPPPPPPPAAAPPQRAQAAGGRGVRVHARARVRVRLRVVYVCVRSRVCVRVCVDFIHGNFNIPPESEVMVANVQIPYSF
jgi:hypothetical protein